MGAPAQRVTQYFVWCNGQVCLFESCESQFDVKCKCYLWMGGCKVLVWRTVLCIVLLFNCLLWIFSFVCRTPWKKCCFSGDGEYIVAGSARQHALYIWEKSIGNLVKILHGTRGELLLDVAVRTLPTSAEFLVILQTKLSSVHQLSSSSFLFHINLVASCPADHSFHFQWRCIHMGSESSGKHFRLFP